MRALSCLHVHADLWFAETDTSTDTIKSEALTPESMYTEDQIRKAADGKTEGAGGLNVPDIKKILTASGLSASGKADEVRAILKENLASCLACQGFATPSGVGFPMRTVMLACTQTSGLQRPTPRPTQSSRKHRRLRRPRGPINPPLRRSSLSRCIRRTRFAKQPTVKRKEQAASTCRTSRRSSQPPASPPAARQMRFARY